MGLAVEEDLAASAQARAHLKREQLGADPSLVVGDPPAVAGNEIGSIALGGAQGQNYDCLALLSKGQARTSSPCRTTDAVGMGRTESRRASRLPDAMPSYFFVFLAEPVSLPPLASSIRQAILWSPLVQVLMSGRT